jgi:hypothetical protein
VIFQEVRATLRNVNAGQLISTLANVGVIVGLIFLILEIRQANRIAKATTEIGTRSLISETNEAHYAVPGFPELLVKLKNKNAELSEVELIRANGYFYRLANAWQATVVAYNNDMVPLASYAAIEDDIRSMLTSYPAMAPILRKFIDEYPSQESEQLIIIMQRTLDEMSY